MKKNQIENIVESRETKAGLYFDYVIQALIFLSIISFSVETIPDLSDQTKEFLNLVELVCIVIFSIEYLIRIYLAKSKLKFIFSFFGLIDLIAILPFYYTAFYSCFSTDQRGVDYVRSGSFSLDLFVCGWYLLF
jgi:voltage-gated potassium channel